MVLTAVSLLLLTCMFLQEETGLVLLVNNALAALSRPVNAVGGIDFSLTCLHCYSH